MNTVGMSVIIITYNRKEDLKKTLRALALQKKPEPCELIVVDQNSTDGTAEMIGSEFPDVICRRLERNLGVPGGRNIGAALARYEYMVFIDDDAEFIGDGALLRIQRIFDTGPGINVIAFQVLDPSGGLFDWPYPKKYVKRRQETFAANMYIGCGHAIRKSHFDAVGGYSPELFFWGEEIEFCQKTFEKSGSSVLYAGSIPLLHRVAESGRIAERGGRYYYKVRNRLAIILNMYPAGCRAFYLVCYIAVYGVKSILLRAFRQYLKGLRECGSIRMTRAFRVSPRSLKRYLRVYQYPPAIPEENYEP